MNTTMRACWLAPIATAIALGLTGCGGSDSDDAAPATPPAPEQPAPPPQTPVPKFTYTPDPQVCAWVDAYVEPFKWPADRVGPRTWPEIAPIVTHPHPVRNEQGVPHYTVESNDWVLSAHYAEQAQALGVPPATFAPDATDSEAWKQPHTRLWLQQVACTHGIQVKGAADYMFTAHMSDEAAALVAREQYAARVRQTDLCGPGFVFPTAPPEPTPPECNAPAE